MGGVLFSARCFHRGHDMHNMQNMPRCEENKGCDFVESRQLCMRADSTNSTSTDEQQRACREAPSYQSSAKRSKLYEM
jgi:hypothetical protein